jgi:hypothetical protein
MRKIGRFLTLLFGTGFLFAACSVPEKTVTKDYEETFIGIKEIVLEGKFLEISYEGNENDSEVFLNGFLEAPENSGMEITYRKSGSRLNIEVVGDLVIGWNFGNQVTGFISLTGPEDIKLNLVNSSGSIDVMHVVHDVVDLKVNSGSIKTLGIIADQINLTASSGSIKGEGLAGKVNAQVNSGSIKFLEVEGDISAKASSGSLKFENVEGLVNAQVNSGSIKFLNVSQLGELSASSGSIKAENSGLAKNTTLKVNSGSINIQTNSDLNAFNYDLSASSGSVKVGENSSSKRLNIDNNSAHTITGKASSGSIKIWN